ncbi:MAG: hypothetical protein COV30_01905 [Candidatus Yanofskybacteria bacterium CG10_big_fil_rev_8_21_14_0_10_37_15]|uniref:Uncharacterized protein n=1 Tax=Candidatus Yanofskybacteria bacterium CG10_big_fil_rev_8_21_14_0_10_37_15 TaxID=1975097 RepID=A0A2H0R5H9_9BACT|nr:MAG: hypothetical protein COV30_01905 [Candidatus Yanofskybacteria bacterium CG10_big_fil_rev_8_21_14_0_10_37_15]
MIKNNKGTTLDELANMIAKGFGEVDLKFEALASRDELFAVEKRLEKKLSKMGYQLEGLRDFEEVEVLDLQKRVQILEKAVRALANSQSSK